MSKIQNILPEDNVWQDRRLSLICHNEFACAAEPPKNAEEWRDRRDFTCAQVAMAAGLSPMPEKKPLKPVITGHVRHEGTIISKVRFESMPGLEVTGNLYMPERVRDQAPGILCPHGHWPDGRIHNGEDGSGPLFYMMLARLGFIVFAYDMLGYNDCCNVMHLWSEELRRSAAIHGVSQFGLQTWNSLRALDFLCGLPEVDERRIGCAGSESGAAQAWTVALLDERIKVIAPAGMLSSHYQGGCQCDEGPLLRLNGVTSFDILAACAPRPLLLPSATLDWTNLNLEYEVRALHEVYRIFDATDALKAFRIDAPNNFNRQTREHIYPWFTHWLLNQSLRENIVEDELMMPPEGVLLLSDKKSEPEIHSTRKCIGQAAKHLCAGAFANVSNVSELEAFRRDRISLAGEIFNYDQNLKDVAVRVTYPAWKIEKSTVRGCLVSRRDVGDIIPAVHVIPDVPCAMKTVCLMLGGEGKAEFLHGGALNTVMNLLVDNGQCCFIPDLMGTGETASMPEKSMRNESDPLFYAFNPSLFSMRVQDVLTCLKLLHELGYERISVIAAGNAVKPVLAALAISEGVFAAVIDMNGQSDADEEWTSFLNFHPMIQKLGGMKGLAALANVKYLGLYKASDDIFEYVNAFSTAVNVPGKVTAGSDSFLRLVEYVACKNTSI